MNKIIKKYTPMSETGFYILSMLTSPQHGYSISLMIEAKTNKRIKIGPGTIYGTLSKMENDKLIQFICEQSNRKIYVITDIGRQILDNEISRIKCLYQDSLEVNLYE